MKFNLRQAFRTEPVVTETEEDAAPAADGKEPAAQPLVAQPPADTETGGTLWTNRLVFFLRAMAIFSMFKGIYHWAEITGFINGAEGGFEYQTTPWQSATVYFAVIQLVAAVGLWLATPWGAVVWLTTIVSQAVIELMFPDVYGGHFWVVLLSVMMLAAYLALAWMAARERPP